MLDIFKVIVFSFVEGFTEFLPISSTAHLILTEKFVTLSSNSSFMNAFQIIIQLGAIFSVVVCFFNELLSNKKWWGKIIVAVIPSAVLGLMLDDYITENFFNVKIVLFPLFIYGVLIIFLENYLKNKKNDIDSIDKLSYKKALYIGFFQCLALIPGTSRSASTIIGSLLLGVSRVVAAKFSFFLAIPTMLGASLLKIIKLGNVLNTYEYLLIGLGFIFSFIFSFIFIKIFMKYIKKYDFKIFGYYRIIVSFIFAVLIFKGIL